MPKYYLEKVAGYYLYYTKHCIIECMHAMPAIAVYLRAVLLNFLLKATAQRFFNIEAI